MNRQNDKTEPDEKQLITAQQAMGALNFRRRFVHTFVQAGPLLIGANWGKSAVKAEMERALHIEIAGGNARGMGHAIVIVRPEPQPPVFLEHDEKRLVKLEQEEKGKKKS